MSEEDIHKAEDDAALAAMDADAVLRIRHANRMSETEKFNLAEWLRLQAESLLAEGHLYNEIFTGRYNPEE